MIAAGETEGAAVIAPATNRGDASGWRVEASTVTRVVAGGILAGLVSGFLFGGIGGRLAMRLVAVQTEDRFQGLTTDDGATTGEISLGGTLALVAFVTLVGVLGGILYVAVRPVLPSAPRARAAVWGGVTGIVGGSLVVQSDGVDFTLLGSPATSIAVFVVILALYGVGVAAVAERLLRPDGWVRTAPLVRVLPAYVLLLPGLVLAPVVAAGAAVTALRASGLAARIPARPVELVGRIVLLGVVGAMAITLAGTVADLV